MRRKVRLDKTRLLGEQSGGSRRKDQSVGIFLPILDSKLYSSTNIGPDLNPNLKKKSIQHFNVLRQLPRRRDGQ